MYTTLWLHILILFFWISHGRILNPMNTHTTIILLCTHNTSKRPKQHIMKIDKDITNFWPWWGFFFWLVWMPKFISQPFILNGKVIWFLHYASRVKFLPQPRPASFLPQLWLFYQICPCADVVLYSCIRLMQKSLFSLSSCKSNMYVLIIH